MPWLGKSAGRASYWVAFQRLVVALAVIASAMTWNRSVTGQAQPVGPSMADFLLRTGGELDGSGNGAGARRLATEPGYTIIAGPGCFPTVATDKWCGRPVVTPPVLWAAYIYWKN